MVCPPWHVSRLAVASVNTHRTRWPTPTPTQTQSYIHLCTQMYNPPPPDGVAFLLPPASTLPASPSTRLHGHQTSSLLSRWPGIHPHPPVKCVNFAKETWTYRETIHGGGEEPVSWKLNDWCSIDSRLEEIRDWIFRMCIIYSFVFVDGGDCRVWKYYWLVGEWFVFNFYFIKSNG